MIRIPRDNVMRAFTPWTRWADRSSIPDGVSDDPVAKYGGVYVLAHHVRPPAGVADPLHDAIVYVGEGSLLGRRWDQFHRSGFRGLSGHSGGHAYRDWVRGRKPSGETLYVAALPIWFANEGDTNAPMSRARRYRLLLEQLILWELTLMREGRDLPLLNKR
jgi:hypothetical protein